MKYREKNNVNTSEFFQISSSLLFKI